ncbi:unnamed protein product [Rotaria magnacalcarata]|uniref:Uncharacterized protein n=1 Tax=Rotaria magnacalcarata TaxID=392030 RepID=A0A815VMZ9_9BILA|nr:unnamed protein product [Rotaria magnacalcarata]CAF1534160.1 unnamed protein product [Rotaria magnacalcarata]CAF5096075.1 unnamed protein product [Rotaria magnacalcarata]
MQPFSVELLTILALVSISLSGVIFIAVIILAIFLIYKSCSKRRRPVPIHPKQKRSSTISVSTRNDTVTKTSLPTEDILTGTNTQKTSEQHRSLGDAIGVRNERTNPFYNKNKKSQQKIYTNDDNDRTTAIHEHNTNSQNYHIRHHQQTFQPISNVPAAHRSTPYPEDVIVRDKLMNKHRFPTGHEY